MPITTPTEEVSSDDALNFDGQCDKEDINQGEFVADEKGNIKQQTSSKNYEEDEDCKFKKEKDILVLKFDDYVKEYVSMVKANPLSAFKKHEMSMTTLTKFPTIFDDVIQSLCNHFFIKGHVSHELIINYGLNRIKDEEIYSFGLDKKINIINKINKFIPMSKCKDNDLKVVASTCHSCKKNFHLSEETSSFFMEIKSRLNIGSGDLLTLCILLSLGDSDFVNNTFKWFNSYKLKREKKGLKLFKVINHNYREMIRTYTRELDMVRADYIVREQEKNHWTDEDIQMLKAIVDLREEILHMRLEREFSKEEKEEQTE